MSTGYFHHLCRFFDAQPAKKSQFDHTALALVHLRQPPQRVVQSDQIHVRMGTHDQRFIEIHVGRAATSFLIAARSREVDQDPSHELRANGKKMGAVLPFDLADTDQAEIGFMNQGGGLKGMSRAFAGHITSRRHVQLVVHERHQFLQGGFVPLPPCL